VADLTGQPYLPPDRATADAMATVPGIELAVHDCTLNDVPDISREAKRRAPVRLKIPGRTSPVPSNAAGATAASTGVVGATASVVPHSRAFGNPQVSGPTFRKIAGSGQRTLRLPGLPGHVGRAGRRSRRIEPVPPATRPLTRQPSIRYIGCW
jgi:hypothetical protein